MHTRGIVRHSSRLWRADRLVRGGISIAVAAVSGSSKLGLPAKASYFSLLNQAGLLVKPPFERIFDSCNFRDISTCTDIFEVKNKEVINYVNA